MLWYSKLLDALSHVEENTYVFAEQISIKGSRKFLVCTQNEMFSIIEARKLEERAFYEIVLCDHYCKFYMDIELSVTDGVHDKKLLDLLKGIIEFVWVKKGTRNVIVLDASTQHKESYHLIWPRVLAVGNRQHARFAKEMVDELSTNIICYAKSLRFSKQRGVLLCITRGQRYCLIAKRKHLKNNIYFLHVQGSCFIQFRCTDYICKSTAKGIFPNFNICTADCEILKCLHSASQTEGNDKMNICLDDINLPNDDPCELCTDAALPTADLPVIKQIINGEPFETVLVIIRHKRKIEATWLLTIQDAFNLTSNVQIDKMWNGLIEETTLPRVAKLMNVSVIHTSPEKFLFIQKLELLETPIDQIQKQLEQWEPVGIKRENFRVPKEMMIIELNTECTSCVINGIVSNIKGPTKWFKDQKSGEFLSFDITDQSAKIRGVLFQDTLMEFSEYFKDGNKLRIINPRVLEKNVDFATSDYETNYEIHIKRTTVVQNSSKRLKFS
ncbi:uncharacterized protein LOC129588942 [Paramacrobiotus metropolitanus]|uniref:uncharacterized protein LOC129588942 n=1 Tax=Paramacrobiotus metropolitanus TaxID=2943436 RepID=UPI0024459653|nr:uncharacterized protein LOC129588942 [Paramacrobiotus metropolitanus]